MFDGIPLVQVGAGTLVGIIVLMVLTGRLITRREKDDALADRDAWRKVALEQGAQLTQLLEYARAADAVFRSLPKAASEAQKGSP